MANPKAYKVQLSLHPKYAPLIQRGKNIDQQVPRSTFPEKRKAGESHLDLWLDGSIYPVDPRTGKRPKFNCLKGLLEFVGDGADGLMGYVTSLESRPTDSIERQYIIEICTLKEQMLELQRELKETQLQLQSIPEFQSEIEILRRERCLLDERLNTLSMQVYTAEVEKQGLELTSRLESESHATEKHALLDLHKKELKAVKSELFKTKATLNRILQKMERLKKTPLGFRTQVRQRKDLSNLSQTGGHAKAQKRLMRSILGPATARKVQENNANTGKSRRLYGDDNAQMQSGHVLRSFVSRTEIKSMLNTPSMGFVGKKYVNYYLDEIRKHMGPEEVLEVADNTGITREGYNSFFKKFKSAAKLAGSGIRVTCLPNPHQVKKLRLEMNSKLQDLIGKHQYIQNTLILKPAGNSKVKGPMKYELSQKNSFFTDVEAVMRTMVRLYGFTPEEVQGKPLVFVLKLDEAEIIHMQKMERVSITIMNRALDSNILPNTPEYFSVQSEREIWPICSFQVPKETHEVLKWVFNQTDLPNLIAAHEAGQLLKVPEVGEFQIEWHLSADMKTIKSMYALKGGANSKYCCIYCNQERSKVEVSTVAHAIESFRGKKFTWVDGLFSTKIPAKPLPAAQRVGRWKPVLPIPIERVHICTLHCLNRIVEKILHLHFMFLWTIRDTTQQKLAIEDMQRVLSATGAHGGNVLIFKDTELSGKSNNVPNKPSLSGANCSKIFKGSTLSGGSNKVWKDIVHALRNFQGGGEQKRVLLEMWSALDELRQYFTKLSLSDEQRRMFKTKVESFGRLYVHCFGEQHVTHYMHVLVKHATWFVDEYGSLSVWSCQGMEYSHHAAKSAYFKHTQHSGGTTRKSALLQTFEHWFRIIQHRLRNKQTSITDHVKDDTDDEAIAAVILARRERSLASSAQAHWENWRQNCTRQGSKWVPNPCIEVLPEDLEPENNEESCAEPQ